MENHIKGILFDSGRVLNGPVTGHWMIPPNFYHYIDQKKFNSIAKTRRKLAFQLANDYLNKQNLIVTEEEEYGHFFEYYRMFFDALPELKVSEEQLSSITNDLVYNGDKYSFFEDAVAVIPELYKRFKLAIVSDAWPSLERVFGKAGMREYFSSFIISSQLGVLKPDEMMYKKALEDLELQPHEVIFIDDSMRNCDGAKKVGIEKTYLLSRNQVHYLYNRIRCKDHKVIKCLWNLKV